VNKLLLGLILIISVPCFAIGKICTKEASFLHSKMNKVQLVSSDNKMWILGGAIDSNIALSNYPISLPRQCYKVEKMKKNSHKFKNRRVESEHYRLYLTEKDYIQLEKRSILLLKS